MVYRKIIHLICSIGFLATIILLLIVEDAVLFKSILVLSGVLLILDFFVIRCINCGTHPTLYLFAVWSVLLSPELYLADTILLRVCPKCGKDVFHNGNQSKD